MCLRMQGGAGNVLEDARRRLRACRLPDLRPSTKRAHAGQGAERHGIQVHSAVHHDDGAPNYPSMRDTACKMREGCLVFVCQNGRQHASQVATWTSKSCGYRSSDSNGHCKNDDNNSSSYCRKCGILNSKTSLA